MTTHRTRNAPEWPAHHDGKPLTRAEVAQHDPALALRFAPALRRLFVPGEVRLVHRERGRVYAADGAVWSWDGSGFCREGSKERRCLS